MTAHDTVIAGGLVVTPEGVRRGDIGIREGRISAIGKPSALDGRERGDGYRRAAQHGAREH